MDWPDRAGIARHRMALRLAGDDHPYPEFAACLIVARGARGMTVEEFAALGGVAPDVLTAMEAGDLPPSHASGRLVELADELPPEVPAACNL